VRISFESFSGVTKTCIIFRPVLHAELHPWDVVAAPALYLFGMKRQPFSNFFKTSRSQPYPCNDVLATPRKLSFTFSWRWAR
jgi:hypothetical protein